MTERGGPETEILQKLIDASQGGLEQIKGDQPVWRMARKHHRTAKDKPLTFDKRPFLKEIYQLWTSDVRNIEVSILKAPQEGISEWALCTVITLAGEFGLSVFYVLPKYELRNVFVKSNVNRIISNTDRYKDRMRQGVGATDSLQLKLIGRGGLIVFPSANVETDFVSIPADIGLIDEIDRCIPDNLGLLDDRLSGLDSRKIKIYISSPKLKGRGISEKYEESDQRKWNVPCNHCGHYQELDWWRNVMKPVSGKADKYALIDRKWKPGCGRDIYVYCQSCGEPMKRSSTKGKWVVTHPENAGHYGYHISKLFSGASLVEEGYDLWKKGQEDPEILMRFYNSFLGLGYDAPGAGILESDLQACAAVDPYYMPNSWKGGRIILGCDVGKVLHVHISEVDGLQRRKLFIGTLPLEIQPIVDIYKRYGVQIGVIDAGPETLLVANLKAVLNVSGVLKIWSCSYQRSALRASTQIPTEARLTIDRTYALDQTFADVRARRTLLPTDWRGIDGGKFMKAMTEPKRIADYVNGEFVWIWEKTKSDHHRHADTYEWIASTLLLPVSVADYSVDAGSGDRMVRRTTTTSGCSVGVTGARVFQEGAHHARGGRFL